MLENSQRTIDQSISRRECVGLVAMLAGASLVGIARPSEAATNNEQEFQNTLDQLGNDPELAAQMRGVKEYNEFFPDLQLEKAPIKIKPSNTPVSERSIDLIVRCEVTSETY